MVLAYLKSLPQFKKSLVTLFLTFLRFSVTPSTCANCDLIRKLKDLWDFERVGLRAFSVLFTGFPSPFDVLHCNVLSC